MTCDMLYLSLSEENIIYKKKSSVNEHLYM